MLINLLASEQGDTNFHQNRFELQTLKFFFHHLISVEFFIQALVASRVTLFFSIQSHRFSTYIQLKARFTLFVRRLFKK